MDLQYILSLTFYGNSVQALLLALVIFLGTIIALKIVQSVLLLKLKHLAEKTKTEWDDEIIAIVATLKPRIYTLVSAYLALRWLRLPAEANKFINIVFLIVITWEALQIAQRLIAFAISQQLGKTENEERKNASVIRNINGIAKFGLWAMALLLVLQNLGVNVTSLIAGLGIGGLAIALAAQNILGDLFSSFSIFFDKPFQVDDFIQIGTHSGTVKAIGLKTTRLQTLQGEELVVSNRELTSSRIQNFGKLKKRRTVTTLGLEYNTSNGKISSIPGWLKKIVDDAPNAEFDRAHFKAFEASSLDVELVFFVASPDYYIYMDTLQNINLSIKEKFEAEGIGFAYPTQTLHLKK